MKKATKTPPPLPPKKKEISVQEFAKALYDFEGEDSSELSFKKGEIVEILQKFEQQEGNSGWWKGKHPTTGREGFFPRTFVEPVSSVMALATPVASPALGEAKRDQVRALYDYVTKVKT